MMHLATRASRCAVRARCPPARVLPVTVESVGCARAPLGLHADTDLKGCLVVHVHHARQVPRAHGESAAPPVARLLCDVRPVSSPAVNVSRGLLVGSGPPGRVRQRLMPRYASVDAVRVTADCAEVREQSAEPKTVRGGMAEGGADARPGPEMVDVQIWRFPVLLGRALQTVAGNWQGARDAVPSGTDLQGLVNRGLVAMAGALSQAAVTEAAAVGASRRPKRAAAAEPDAATHVKRVVKITREHKEQLDKVCEAMGSDTSAMPVASALLILVTLGSVLRGVAAAEHATSARAGASPGAPGSAATPATRARPATGVSVMGLRGLTARVEGEVAALGDAARLPGEAGGAGLAERLGTVVKKCADEWFQSHVGTQDFAATLEEILEQPVLQREVPPSLQPVYDAVLPLVAPPRHTRSGVPTDGARDVGAKRLMYMVVNAFCPPGKMGLCALQIANTLHFMRDRVGHATMRKLHEHGVCLLPANVPALGLALRSTCEKLGMKRLKESMRVLYAALPVFKARLAAGSGGQSLSDAEPFDVGGGGAAASGGRTLGDAMGAKYRREYVRAWRTRHRHIIRGGDPGAEARILLERIEALVQEFDVLMLNSDNHETPHYHKLQEALAGTLAELEEDLIKEIEARTHLSTADLRCCKCEDCSTFNCPCAKGAVNGGHKCGPACLSPHNNKKGLKCGCAGKDKTKHNLYLRWERKALSKGARAGDTKIGAFPRELRGVGTKLSYHIVQSIVFMMGMVCDHASLHAPSDLGFARMEDMPLWSATPLGHRHRATFAGVCVALPWVLSARVVCARPRTR